MGYGFTYLMSILRNAYVVPASSPSELGTAILTIPCHFRCPHDSVPEITPASLKGSMTSPRNCSVRGFDFEVFVLEARLVVDDGEGDEEDEDVEIA